MKKEEILQSYDQWARGFNHDFVVGKSYVNIGRPSGPLIIEASVDYGGNTPDEKHDIKNQRLTILATNPRRENLGNKVISGKNYQNISSMIRDGRQFILEMISKYNRYDMYYYIRSRSGNYENNMNCQDFAEFKKNMIRSYDRDLPNDASVTVINQTTGKRIVTNWGDFKKMN